MMFNVPFVDSASSIGDGLTNGVASKLGELRRSKSELDKSVGDIDIVLDGIKRLELDGFGLPSVPDFSDLSDTVYDVNATVQSGLNDLEIISGLAGSCLDGGMAALGSIAGDARKFLNDTLGGFEGSVPPEILNLQRLMDVYREQINKLGIGKLINELRDKLGCLSDSSIIDGVNDEISSLSFDLGLDASGNPADNTYYDSMKQKMLDAGLDTGYADSLSTLTSNVSTQTAAWGDSMKSKATEQLQALKPPVAPTKSLPSFW